MAHNYIQDSDVLCDPDMEIAIHHNLDMAEALTYQQDSLGIYQEIYDQFPNPTKQNTKLKKELNSFLKQWLRNALDQGSFFNYNCLQT